MNEFQEYPKWIAEFECVVFSKDEEALLKASKSTIIASPSPAPKVADAAVKAPDGLVKRRGRPRKE